MTLTTKTLTDRIAERLELLNKSAHQVSVAATGNGEAIREIKRGKMPGADRLLRIARELDTTPEWLMGLSDDPSPGPAALSYDPPAQAVPAPNLNAPVRSFGGRPTGMLPPLRDLPVHGTALGTSMDLNHGVPIEMHLVEMGETIEHVRRPPGLTHKESYALYIAGDSQSPRFEPGELIFVNPRRPVAPGDDVVVQLRDENTGEVVSALIKRLVRRTPTGILLRQFNPSAEFEVRATMVHAIHRVMTLAELLGN